MVISWDWYQIGNVSDWYRSPLTAGAMLQCIMVPIIGMKDALSRVFWCDATKFFHGILTSLKQWLAKTKKAHEGL
ncbi:hypothetical protein [Sulfuritalea sp.]|uniref:hypothetical protein n=1 Tax=Sulfuritalea sp. TaxID=2480090 RepID=UPI00286E15FC|nr:hypothetical protein [Sulfuritalea sp.]